MVNSLIISFPSEMVIILFKLYIILLFEIFNNSQKLATLITVKCYNLRTSSRTIQISEMFGGVNHLVCADTIMNRNCSVDPMSCGFKKLKTSLIK